MKIVISINIQDLILFRLRSSLSYASQSKVMALLENYHDKLESNSIHNGAVLVVEVETGRVISYVGNTRGINEEL